jgi:hypothetical protein
VTNGSSGDSFVVPYFSALLEWVQRYCLLGILRHIGWLGLDDFHTDLYVGSIPSGGLFSRRFGKHCGRCLLGQNYHLGMASLHATAPVELSE